MPARAFRPKKVVKSTPPPQSSKGLGDSVEKVLHATGLDKVAKVIITSLTGEEDCGCGARKDKLNEIFPYKEQQ